MSTSDLASALSSIEAALDLLELFFHATDQHLMALDVTPGDTLQPGTPRALFRTNPAVLSAFIFLYAATPDGQRFLLLEPADGAVSASEPLYALTNWASLLAR